MSSDILYTQANRDSELHEILALQSYNKESAISKEDSIREGFVYVHHDIQILREMNKMHGHVIAKHKGVLVAYALIMHPTFKSSIPSLIPMFETFNQCTYENSLINEEEYVVMGQICIEKSFRKKGIFRGLYAKMSEVLSGHYKYIITEVATRNQRSLQAHFAVGFEEIYSYIDPQGEHWSIVLLNLKVN